MAIGDLGTSVLWPGEASIEAPVITGRQGWGGEGSRKFSSAGSELGFLLVVPWVRPQPTRASFGHLSHKLWWPKSALVRCVSVVTGSLSAAFCHSLLMLGPWAPAPRAGLLPLWYTQPCFLLSHGDHGTSQALSSVLFYKYFTCVFLCICGGHMLSGVGFCLYHWIPWP